MNNKNARGAAVLLISGILIRFTLEIYAAFFGFQSAVFAAIATTGAIYLYLKYMQEGGE